MKPLLFLLLLFLIATIAYLLQPKTTDHLNAFKASVSPLTENTSLLKLKNKAATGKPFLKHNGFSTQYIFLVDMSLPSGKARFFVYDALKDSIIHSGLVAHGSCRTKYLTEAQFSNLPECGCSSIGKYKISSSYHGRFGKAFKLLGLDSSNSNAFKRTIVLHAFDCVPDKEADPYPICNSLGCPMVSYKFLDTISGLIERSKKPILLWIFR